MKLIELAKILEATPEDLVKYFKERRNIVIPLDNSYELNYEIAKKAYWKLTPKLFESYKNKYKDTTFSEMKINRNNHTNVNSTAIQSIGNLINIDRK